MSHGGDDLETRSIDQVTADLVAETMQALATPSRVRILAALGEAPRSVGELAKVVGMEQSAVSHQLRLLRHLRLVVGERAGRSVIYNLHDDHVSVLLAEAVSHVRHLQLGISNPATAATAATSR